MALKINSDIQVGDTGLTLGNLVPTSKTINIVSDYIYSTDFDCRCYVIGKLCILNIGTIAFKSVPSNNVAFLTGLPNATKVFYSYLVSSSNTAIRIMITESGTMRLWWTPNNPPTADSSNKQCSGTFIYPIK